MISKCLLVAISLIVCACRSSDPPPIAADPVNSAEPASPRCTHEVCAERPKRLRCTNPEYGVYNQTCRVYEIDYEHHCHCDTWGPPL